MRKNESQPLSLLLTLVEEIKFVHSLRLAFLHELLKNVQSIQIQSRLAGNFPFLSQILKVPILRLIFLANSPGLYLTFNY